jgi:glucose-1-phosphate cytidylyltransferase
VKVVILAGGYGTRLEGETLLKPKPMVEVGGRPLLWHIMRQFAAHGFDDFVVALGYLGDVVKRYFLDYHRMNGDFTVRLADGAVEWDHAVEERWTVRLVDTGIGTATGGRLRRLRRHLDDGTFLMTYGDGLADVDVVDLVGFHRSHGRAATVTAVRPPGRFGALALDDDVVTRFAEKSSVGEGWINGGFFVLEPAVLDRIASDDTEWERQPLEGLACDGELRAFRHDGFWQGIDTPRDLRHVEAMYERGDMRWHSGARR